jgi:hypothetical protein
MAKKRQVSVYLDEDVEKVLEKQMKMSKNTGFSAAINDAVRYAAFPEHRQDRDADLYKMMQLVLDSFVQHRKKTARDLAFIQELAGELLTEVYRHNAPLSEEQFKERDAEARARAVSFVEDIVRNMPALKSFSDREVGE